MVLTDPGQRELDWRLWTAALVGIYLLIGIAGFQRSLTPDEIRPLLLASAPLGEQLDVARQDLVQTPASYLLGRLWLNLFGHTDTAAKTLALLLNVPTLVLFTLLARRLTPHWAMASFLFALPFLRVGSTANLVRMYGLLLLCVVAALLLWLRWRERPTAGWLLAWLGVMVLAVYTLASALLLLPAFVIAVWLFGPARIRFTAVAALVPVALVPWFVYVSDVYAERGITDNVQAIQDDPTKAVAKLPFYLLSGENPGANSPLGEKYRREGMPTALKWGALLLHLALLALAVPRLLAAGWPPRLRDAAMQSWWMIALFAFVPIAVLYVFSLLISPVVNARYLLVGVPAYLLLLAMCAGGARVPGRVLFAALAIWMALSVRTAYALNVEPTAARRSVAVLSRELQPSDVVVVERHMPLGWELVWEWTRRVRRPEPINVLTVDWMPVYLRDIVPGVDLDQLDVSNAQRIWFVHRDRNRVKEFTAFTAARGFQPAAFAGAFTSLQLFARSPHAGVTPAVSHGEPAR